MLWEGCTSNPHDLQPVVILVQDCFELGVILLRKKLYTQATKNLEKASRMWDGEPEELAQVHLSALSASCTSGEPSFRLSAVIRQQRVTPLLWSTEMPAVTLLPWGMTL